MRRHAVGVDGRAAGTTGRPLVNRYGSSPWPVATSMRPRGSFALLIGMLADGRPLPYLCRVRRCISPAHLDPADGTTAAQRASAACANDHGRNLRGLIHAPLPM